MARQPDDFARLEMWIGDRTILLEKLGLDWPPPARLTIDEEEGLREWREGDDPVTVMGRISMSKLTDEETADMDHVARGALYRYEIPEFGKPIDDQM